VIEWVERVLEGMGGGRMGRVRMGFDKFGYRKLIVWQQAKQIRRKTYLLTQGFPKSEMRRISQMNDAARSVKQNIQEGYRQSSRKNYIRYLGIAQGSLSELVGDIEDCYEDKLINQKDYQLLEDLVVRTDYLFKRLILALKKKTLPTPS